MANDLELLREKLRDFVRLRNWKQFHTPKNLTLALVGEVGELASLIQWVEPADFDVWLKSPANATALRHELADVLAYTIQLSDAVGVDLGEALVEKIAINEANYPVHLSRDNSTKYTKFQKGLGEEQS